MANLPPYVAPLKNKIAARGAGAPLAFNGVPSTAVLPQTLTPAAVTSTSYQTFTFTGLVQGDLITGIVFSGTQTATVTVKGWRVVSYAAGTVEIVFGATGTATPAAGTYNVTVGRMTGGAGQPHLQLIGSGSNTIAAATTTALTGTLQSIPLIGNKVRHCGRVSDWTSAGYVNFYGPWTCTKVTGGNAGQTGSVMRFDFETDATKFEMFVNGTAWRFQVIVDGQIVTPVPFYLPNNFKVYRVLFDFTQGGTVTPANTPRKIRIEAVNGASVVMVGGLVANVADSVWAPASANSIRALMFGDSWTEGYLLPYEFTGFANQVGYMMGWDELIISGVGGTGYLRNAPGGTLTWRGRVNDIIGQNPDIVVILGSVNDQIGGFTAAQVGAEAALFYQQLVAALPNIPILVAGTQINQPTRANSAATNQILLDMNTAIKAAIAPYSNCYWIEMNGAGDLWFTGSGLSTAPTGDGNADRFIASDGTHPVQVGHDYLARRLVAATRALVK